MAKAGAVRAALTVVAVGAWFAMRAGLPLATPRAFSVLAALTILACAIHLGLALPRLSRRAGFVAGLASLSFSAGVVLIGGAGLANWLMGIQGYVVLTEKEAMPLAATTHLGGLDIGPLARASERDVTLGVEEVELRPVEPNGFEPVTHLIVSRPGEQPSQRAMGPRQPARVGALRFHQGAFGFAPRVVILKDGRTVIDRAVPFRTHPDPSGLLFEGAFEVEAEKLLVNGTVTLEGLDDRMKGHPSLALAVTREGRDLGGGTLAPGHFAELSEGYRIGFAGMKRWSEIDVSRGTYSWPIWIGLGLVAGALLVWPVAAWRRW
jgi:hypothetical protein